MPTPRPTSRDYAHPHRPWPRRLYDAIARDGLGRITAPELIDQARRKVGTARLAIEVEDALTVLLDSLREEARLTPTGRLLTLTDMRSSLRANLRAGAWIDAEPMLAERPLYRTIVITGVARSGTTLLQRMLAQLPGARSLATWEALEPVPPPDWTRPTEAADDPRVGRARKGAGFLRWLSPDLFAVHPMDAEAPEEEAMLLGRVFRSGIPETSYHVPSYARWLEDQDPAIAYRWLVLLLRLLQHQRGGDFWVLKSPHHLGDLDALMDAMPQTIIIQLHRDPGVTVPSFCSLVAHGHGIMSDHVDPVEIGHHWTRRFERMLVRTQEHRRARGEEHIVDVRYEELVADPIGMVERLASRLQLPWSEATRARLEQWMIDNPRHQHGRHRYDAEDFGLDVGALRERFAAYRERFDL